MSICVPWNLENELGDDFLNVRKWEELCSLATRGQSLSVCLCIMLHDLMKIKEMQLVFLFN